ncbi:MAG: GntR family transcriptional regulator, partial [Pseudonocardiales bacterium]|nr:GntR family transcriptional regulator [Pseudonocardiales bacterium]
MTDTLHGQMTDDLRKAIISGELKPGSPLPSEAQFRERYGVSRHTVRRSLQTLEQEGLIGAHVGKGRVVRDRRAMVYRPQEEFEPRRSATMDRFMAGRTDEGRDPSQTIEVAVERADRNIADRLGVPEGTAVVARKRVRYLDGEPFNINDSYYNKDLASDTAIMDPADIPEG